MKKLFIIGIFLFLCIQPATASIIVDTGEGTSPSGPSLYYWQSLYSKFTIDSDYVLNDISGYFNTLTPGNIDLAIYNDSGNQPDELNTVYSGNFNINSADTDWHGIDNVAWNLTSGTYWLQFKVESTDPYYGLMLQDTPNPLDAYGYKTTTGNVFQLFSSGVDFSVKIEGSSQVPIPGAIWLLGSGIIGLVGLKRKLLS